MLGSVLAVTIVIAVGISIFHVIERGNPMKDLAKYYSIRLPNDTRTVYHSKGSTFTGKPPQVAIFKFQSAPIAFLTQFQKCDDKERVTNKLSQFNIPEKKYPYIEGDFLSVTFLDVKKTYIAEGYYIPISLTFIVFYY